MGLLDLLYPPQCLSCGQLVDPSSALCDTCQLSLESVHVGCSTCGEPGNFPASSCLRCQKKPPPFSRAYAPFVHGGPLAHAIHLFKYEDRPDLVRPLVQLALSAAARFLNTAPFVVCAVPLHFQRARQRLYDQGALLAAEIAKRTGREHRSGALVRARATKRQVGLSETEREANVKDAFQAPRPLEGLSFLLVDDVLTTGATARAASQALMNAGAKEVQVFAVARAAVSGPSTSTLTKSGKAGPHSSVVASPRAR